MSSLFQDNKNPTVSTTFNGLNISGLTSKFLEILEDDTIKIPTRFHHLIFDFNQRRITPTNINGMIDFGDYLLLNDLDKFITQNIIYEIDDFYSIDKVHKSKILKLEGLSSSFWDTFEDDDVVIPSKFISLIADFNDRRVTPQNMNDMIRFCDYLSLEDTDKFIIKNSTPTLDTYDLDEDNQDKFCVPCFLTQNTFWTFKRDTEPDYFKSIKHTVNVLTYKDISNPYKTDISYAISTYNLIDWLRFIIQEKGLDFICLEGILKGGSLECLKIIHDLGVPLVLPYNPNQVLFSVKNLECLQYVYQHGCNYESQSNSPGYGRECSNYAGLGKLDCLQFARSNGFPWTEQTTLESSRKSVKCLQYAIREGCAYNLDNCGFEAIRFGQLDCFKYLLQLGLELDSYFSCYGAYYLPILHFLHELGCPFHEKTIDKTIEKDSKECFEFALSIGCPVSTNQLWLAASKNDCQVLETLIKRGAPWSTEICSNAARNGHLNILKYAKEHSLEWDSDTCLKAACHNKLDCLKFAVNNGCPVDLETSNGAAQTGNLECLIFLIENGSPMNQKTIDGALKNREKECFQYLMTMGCPMYKSTRKKAIKKGYLAEV